MNVAVFAYSRTGCETARNIASFFPKDILKLYTIKRLQQTDFLCIGQPSEPLYRCIFSWADAIIFVGSCGIAVRQIAPYVKEKQSDPAVVVIDELATFVIPLLSGHIGGANDLARNLANHLHATPVITTATDINHKFSVDAWAAKNGFLLHDLPTAKIVSATILEQDVPMVCDFPVAGNYPNGIITKNTGNIGIYIGYGQKQPFKQTLSIIPPILHLGIGCRKGTNIRAIEEAVHVVLQTHHIDCRAIKCVSSIDLKANEKGLLEFCANNNWPISFYSAEELSSLKGEFTSSPFVTHITGVDNVCERAALMYADQIIVKKFAYNGVTVALAAENLEVQFG